MSVFDLATCNENGGEKKARFSLSEKQIYLPTMFWFWIEDVFLLASWLVVPGVNELTWLDNEGNQSETRTEFLTHTLKPRTIYVSRFLSLFRGQSH